MSEVNHRRNGQTYSSSGHCWGLSPKVGKVKEADKRGEGPVMDGTLSSIDLGTSARCQLTRKEDGRTKTRERA